MRSSFCWLYLYKALKEKLSYASAHATDFGLAYRAIPPIRNWLEVMQHLFS